MREGNSMLGHTTIPGLGSLKIAQTRTHWYTFGIPSASIPLSDMRANRRFRCVPFSLMTQRKNERETFQEGI